MTRVLPVLAAAVAAFLLSGVYYGVLGSRLARWSDAYAGAQPSPVGTAAVELVRNLVLATVLDWLVRRTDVAQLDSALLLALALWVAFPLVLLSGSVFHEKVPAGLAAVHAGDWLLKLVLGTAVLTLWS